MGSDRHVAGLGQVARQAGGVAPQPRLEDHGLVTHWEPAEDLELGVGRVAPEYWRQGSGRPAGFPQQAEARVHRVLGKPPRGTEELGVPERLQHDQVHVPAGGAVFRDQAGVHGTRGLQTAQRPCDRLARGRGLAAGQVASALLNQVQEQSPGLEVVALVPHPVPEPSVERAGDGRWREPERQHRRREDDQRGPASPGCRPQGGEQQPNGQQHRGGGAEPLPAVQDQEQAAQGRQVVRHDGGAQDRDFGGVGEVEQGQERGDGRDKEPESRAQGEQKRPERQVGRMEKRCRTRADPGAS